MTDLEYLSALQNVYARRAEAIRLMNDIMERHIWSLRHRPLNTMEMLQLSNMKTMIELCARDALISSSDSRETIGGNGNALPAPDRQGGTPSPAIVSPIRPITSVES